MNFQFTYIFYPCSSCFPNLCIRAHMELGNSSWFWHAKNHLVKLQKKWELGRPPHPPVFFSKFPHLPVFCCCRRPLILTLLSPCLCHKIKKIRERLTVEYGECGAECLLGLTFPEAACRELLWSGPLTTNISSKKWHQDTKALERYRVPSDWGDAGKGEGRQEVWVGTWFEKGWGLIRGDVVCSVMQVPGGWAPSQSPAYTWATGGEKRGNLMTMTPVNLGGKQQIIPPKVSEEIVRELEPEVCWQVKWSPQQTKKNMTHTKT